MACAVRCTSVCVSLVTLTDCHGHGHHGLTQQSSGGQEAQGQGQQGGVPGGWGSVSPLSPGSSKGPCVPWLGPLNRSPAPPRVPLWPPLLSPRSLCPALSGLTSHPPVGTHLVTQGPLLCTSGSDVDSHLQSPFAV